MSDPIKVELLYESTNVLYEAAKESIVAEETEISTYEKILKVGFLYEKNVGTFIKELSYTEQQIKKEYDLKHMPNPWRSAKSVVVNAMNHSVSLRDDNGNLKGKSRLQQELKELKTKKEITLDEYVGIIANMITMPKHGFTVSEVKEKFDVLYGGL
jgi:hypothetical protein